MRHSLLLPLILVLESVFECIDGMCHLDHFTST